MRDSARYLRGVRPLAPEELVQYVEGDVTPETIRGDLRDLAVDLGIVERDDGSFVPVPDGMVPAPEGGVDRLPNRYTDRLRDLLAGEYGRDWAEGSTADRLRSTIEELKADYYRRHPVEYDTDVAYAYAVYHLATYFAAGYYVAQDLARSDLLPYDLRVLDVGAGVGGPALGYLEAVPHDALVDYHAVEPAAGADVLAGLLEEAGPNVHPTIHRTTAEAFDPSGVFDVVLFGNVLSELEDPVEVTASYLETVAADGTMVLIGPADKATSTGLRSVERALVDDRGLATVFGPTVRLWPDEHPTDRGWSFVRRGDIERPPYQHQLSDGTGTYRHTSVQYSYAYLRTDGRRRYEVTLTREEAVKMAEMDAHVTERVDVVGAKLSPDLGTDHPLFKVSDGSEAVDHYAVLVQESSLTDTLVTAPYGTLLSLEHVLVLWNDDEEGYNLVVDGEAVVDFY